MGTVLKDIPQGGEKGGVGPRDKQTHNGMSSEASVDPTWNSNLNGPLELSQTETETESFAMSHLPLVRGFENKVSNAMQKEITKVIIIMTVLEIDKTDKIGFAESGWMG